MRTVLHPIISRPHRVARIRAAVAVLAVPLALVAPPTVSAHELPAPSKVTIRVDGDDVTMPGSLRSSRYRFVVSGGGIQVVKVDKGYTRAEFVRDLRSDSKRAFNRTMNNLRFFGGVMPDRGQSAEFWQTLYTGTYWVLPVDGPLPRAADIKAVTVYGSVRATAWPGSSGVVTLHEKRIGAPAQLPRSGRLLVRNRGTDIDLMIVFRLAPGKTIDDLRNDDHEAVDDIAVPVAVLSADTQMLWKYSLRPGNYVFAGIFSLFNDEPFENLQAVRVG